MAKNKHGSFTNDQVDVDMGEDHDLVEVLVRSGDADVWCVADPAAKNIPPGPIAEADNIDVVPAGGGSVIIESSPGTTTIVRLESTGTVAYSLRGLDQ